MALGSRRTELTFCALGAAITVQDNQIAFNLPTNAGFTLTGVSCNARAFGASVTSFNVDVNVAGTSIADGVGTCSTAGTPGYTAIDPATYTTRHIAGGSKVTIDLHANGGTQVTDATVVLYGMWDG
jgi:hypothetical protein